VGGHNGAETALRSLNQTQGFIYLLMAKAAARSDCFAKTLQLTYLSNCCQLHGRVAGSSGLCTAFPCSSAQYGTGDSKLRREVAI